MRSGDDGRAADRADRPPARWRQRLGLLRSLAIYWRPGRQRRLRRLYEPFISPGDIVFDIGAHVGDRAIAFADLGARVVAVEPQPQLRRWLAWLAGRRAGRIELRPVAIGAEPGRTEIAINTANPTISSTEPAWRAAVGRHNPGFAGQRWDAGVSVSVVTLAQLITDHGRPSFCKIDIEGAEAAAIAGLDVPLPALSFEFVAGALDTARQAVNGLTALGDYEYNMIVGERRRFAWPQWVSTAAVEAWLAAGADGIASGDLYARLITPSP